MRAVVVGVWIIALALVAIATSSVYSTFIEEDEVVVENTVVVEDTGPTTHELIMEWEACQSRAEQNAFAWYEGWQLWAANLIAADDWVGDPPGPFLIDLLDVEPLDEEFGGSLALDEQLFPECGERPER